MNHSQYGSRIGYCRRPEPLEESDLALLVCRESGRGSLGENRALKAPALAAADASEDVQHVARLCRLQNRSLMLIRHLVGLIWYFRNLR
jgi:hypothetical protein